MKTEKGDRVSQIVLVCAVLWTFTWIVLLSQKMKAIEAENSRLRRQVDSQPATTGQKWERSSITDVLISDFNDKTKRNQRNHIDRIDPYQPR